jgi:hypothetical protein
MTTNALCTLEEAQAKIASGGRLLLAGDEHVLRQLPRGTWIGGTIPYFMAAQGGTHSTDHVFVTELPPEATVNSIRFYGVDKLPSITTDAADNGFTVIIIPAGSDAHQVYAKEAGTYPGLFLTPIVGWIAGVAVEDIGRVKPLVFNGATGETSADAAVVLHASLPADSFARIEMVNLFRPGSGSRITFPTASFEVGTCIVDGMADNFARWLTEHQVDTRLPLVANYCGAMVNTSIQAVDPAAGTVALYAPVFPGIEYVVAEPIGDYAAEFNKAVARKTIEPTFACNCILNYLYGELEGRQTGDVTGPITFGEIAYQLLNQTMVYLSVRPMPINLSRHVAQVPVPTAPVAAAAAAAPVVPVVAAAPVAPAAPVRPAVAAAPHDANFLKRFGHAMSGLFGRR